MAGSKWRPICIYWPLALLALPSSSPWSTPSLPSSWHLFFGNEWYLNSGIASSCEQAISFSFQNAPPGAHLHAPGSVAVESLSSSSAQPLRIISNQALSLQSNQTSLHLDKEGLKIRAKKLSFQDSDDNEGFSFVNGILTLPLTKLRSSAKSKMWQGVDIVEML